MILKSLSIYLSRFRANLALRFFSGNTDSDFTEQELLGINEIYTEKKDVDEGYLVLDAGAYPGEFMVYAAERGAQVVALEPDKNNLEDLRQLIREKGIEDKIELVEKALWSEEESVDFKEGEKLSSRVTKEGDSEVEAVKFNSLVEEYGCFDFVKMDIEGAEIEAIKSFSESSTGCRPFFAIASYHRMKVFPTFVKIEKILEENGYRCETGRPKHATTWAEPLDS